MPPLESSADSRRHHQPLPSDQEEMVAPSLQRFGRRTADWTRALLRPRGLTSQQHFNSTENMMESMAHPSKMRRNQTDPSLVDCSTAVNDCRQPPQSSAKRIRHFSKSLPVFVYTVILSVLLMAYTEFQLWQMSSSVNENGAHGISSVVMENNNQTRSRLTRLQAMATVKAMSEQHKHAAHTNSSDSILHIIHSRFMQNQPNLLHLGQARLHLLRHFFVASLQKQSSRNFCCIIRADPDLDPNLKEGLIDALRDFNITYVLVASNEVPKSQYQDVALGNINASNVWSGSLENVQEYLGLREPQKVLRGDQSAKNPRHIIETRLDADDGLHAYFVETLQAEASENYMFQSQTWRLWCVASHAEWQYQSLWTKPPPEEDRGSIVALQVNYCVTPGLSVAFLGDDTSIETMPSTMKHEKLMKTRLCTDEVRHPKRNFTSECRSFVPMIMGALRARTPTSAGMLNLVFNGTAMNRRYLSGASKQKDVQGQLWWAVRNYFGFTKEDARSINKHLNSNMKMIAQENLLGQCTRGHSCKNSSQIILRSIVDGST